MAYDSTLPVAYLEEGPVVTVLGQEELTLLDYAEPSQVMVFASRWWRRFKTMLKVSILVTLVGAYPAAIVASHHIDDSPIVLAQQDSWAVPHAGYAVTLIARELEGRGWSGDKANWHPQSRLTAMPAWQEAMANALAEHTELMATLGAEDGVADPDLAAAARLLPVLDSQDMRPRLTAAAEALNRYDGRVARGLADRPDPATSLSAQAGLFASWAEDSRAALSAQINRDVTEWPAGRADIIAFYRAKAKAHIAHQMLSAAILASPSLTRDAELNAAMRRAESVWARAASEKPLIVSNQNGNSIFSNHLASMAYNMVEAAEVTKALKASIETLPERLENTQAETAANAAP